jgi:PAS domain S-box-containing protein
MLESESPMRRRILVIDDNPHIFDDFQTILGGTADVSALDALHTDLLGGEGRNTAPERIYHLDYASQGQEGYDKVKDALQHGQPYQLAFVDMRMPPGWDGLETIASIWQVDPQMQMVLCTAYSDYGWEEIRARLGTTDALLILKKPFDVAEVAQLASALTDKWHLGRQAALQMAHLDRKVAERTAALQRMNDQLHAEITARKQTKKALQQAHDALERQVADRTVALQASEARYRHLVESSQGLICTHDLDGVLLSVNPAVVQALGDDSQAIIGKSLREILTPSTQHLFEAYLEQIRQHPSASGLMRVATQDGTERVLAYHNVRMEEAEAPPYVLGHAQDITELVKAKEALQASEERFRHLVEGSLQGILIHQDFTPLFVNQAYAIMHGYDTPDDILRLETIESLAAPHERARWRQYKEARLRGEDAPTNYEYQAVRKDGSLIWVENKVRMVPWKDATAIQSTVYDITDRKQTEAALQQTHNQLERRVAERTAALQRMNDQLHAEITERQEAEEKLRVRETQLRTITETVNAALFIYQDTQLCYVNPAAEALSGYTREELLGIPFWEVIHPDHRELARERGLARQRGEKLSSRYEIKILTKDGVERWIDYTAGMIEFEGKPAVLGTAFDITKRKQTEEALRQSEARYRALVEGSVQGISVTNMDRTRVFANAALANIFGYDSPEELMHTHASEELPPHEQTRLAEHAAARRRGEPAPSRVEFQAVHTNGTLIELEMLVSPISWDGTPAFLTTFFDITERKQADEARRESEERLRGIVHHSPSAIFLKDRQGFFRLVNNRFEQWYGQPEADVLGKTSYDIYPPEYAELYVSQDREVLESGKMVERELDIPFADGTVHRLLMTKYPVFDTSGHPTGIGTISTDMTERTRAEEALRESETQQRRLAAEQAALAEIGRIISASPDINDVYEPFTSAARQLIPFDHMIICAADHDAGTITNYYVTERDIPARDPGETIPFAGTMTEAIVLDQRGRCFHPQHETEVSQRFPVLLPHYRSGMQSFLAVPLKAQDTMIGVLHLQSCRPDSYTDHDVRLAESVGLQIAGAIANARLYRERQQAEAARRALEEQLRQAQKMEALGTLAGGIAHDFNNILMAILGYTELAAADLSSASQPWQALQEVRAAGKRATDLVQQILAFSRQSEPERRPVLLHVVVNEVIGFLRASLPTTIELRQQIANDAGAVLADPTQMHQVLMNLCTNAGHAMRDTGGVLEIRVDAVEVDAAFVASHPALHPRPHVRLTVRDTGHGMSIEVLERLFDPFFTTKGVGEGTGMGLAVVHGIIADHQGAITVHSTVGEGTTFTLYLPCIHQDAMPETAPPEPSLPHGTGSILFVDDEAMLANLGHAILERLGYDVTVRTSSLEALEAFRAMPQRFDLVITDQTMPQMTGETLAKELRRIRPDIPIILCTGFSHTMHAEKTRALGINALCMKPFAVRDLAVTIQQVLATHTAQVPPAGARILLIDDDDQLRYMLRQQLESAGYEVEEARDGQEGVERYRDAPTDLIVTDLIMPEKEGLETIIELRREFPEVKIIAMSGGLKQTTQDFLPVAQKLGAQRVLRKPFARDELLGAIQQVLRA